jgi:transcriptional regulator with XRE-family HTH domain
MAGIGASLRAIRQQWGLSLREVERRSRSIAWERGDPSFEVSASWLVRLESDGHELTVNKVIALAEIYSLTIEQLLRSIYPRSGETQNTDQLSGPNGTEPPIEDLRKASAILSQAAKPLPDPSLDATTLLPTKNVPFPTPYRRAIIGKLDMTLNPMIPPGSIVQIDTRMTDISMKKDWTHEFQRPIYFVRTQEEYAFGWCELDGNSEWLTLIPHPLSPASSRRWKYREEVENLGRVVAVVIRLAE